LFGGTSEVMHAETMKFEVNRLQDFRDRP